MRTYIIILALLHLFGGAGLIFWRRRIFELLATLERSGQISSSLDEHQNYTLLMLGLASIAAGVAAFLAVHWLY